MKPQSLPLYHYTRILNAGTTLHPSLLLDPYLKDGSQGVTSRLKGWYATHQATKNLEKQFQDFKPFYIDT